VGLASAQAVQLTIASARNSARSWSSRSESRPSMRRWVIVTPAASTWRRNQPMYRSVSIIGARWAFAPANPGSWTKPRTLDASSFIFCSSRAVCSWVK